MLHEETIHSEIQKYTEWRRSHKPPLLVCLSIMKIRSDDWVLFFCLKLRRWRYENTYGFIDSCDYNDQWMY